MTTDNPVNRIDHDPDGINDTFAYDFQVDNATDMVVYADGVLYTASRTVTDLEDPAGGDVVFDSAPAGSITTLTLIREMPLTQLTDYPPYGPFPAKSHEDALDKLTWISQQQQEELDRAAVAPIDAESGTDYTLPSYAAGKFWRWDSALQKIITSEVADQGVLTVGTDVDDVVRLIDDGSGNPIFPSVLLHTGSYYTDSGSADDYILSRTENTMGVDAYFDGMIIVFRPNNSNTGASTIDVSGLGSTSIRTVAAGALAGGEISNRELLTCVYFVDNFRILRQEALQTPFNDSAVPYTAARVQAALEKLIPASSAEIRTGTEAIKYATPLGINDTIFGMGQTWQDLTASRSSGVVYTNTTGRPILVRANTNSSSGLLTIVPTIGGVVFPEVRMDGDSQSAIDSIIVPAGATYKLDMTSLQLWFELR